MRTQVSTAIFLLLPITAPAPFLAAAPGPVREIGPEGYVDNLQALRYPDPRDRGLPLAMTVSGLRSRSSRAASRRSRWRTCTRPGWDGSIS